MLRILACAAALFSLTACGNNEAPPQAQDPIRIATYNVYLNRQTQGQLVADLSTTDNEQAKHVAEIIQRTAPDIILLNEFDYDAASEGLNLFRTNYLEVSQNGAAPAVYPYMFVAPSNTGTPSGHDLDRNGVVTTEPGSRDYGGDAFGYGEFPGQYAMAILSKFPIDAEHARTFQTFLWKDMPGAMLPDDPATEAPADWYSAEALEDFRLSSKNHWDVPIMIGDKRVHVLASHPTPPGFDGEEDRNGKRNHDELRFWADYIDLGEGGYIYDDKGVAGGLAPNTRFVILGDLNADPNDGGAVPGAIGQLINSPMVKGLPHPRSNGGVEQAALQGGANLAHIGPPAEDTSDFNDDPDLKIGNLHLDFVLVSDFGFEAKDSGVFWPGPDEEYYELIGTGFPVVSSDHRLVWRDLVLTED